MRTNLRDLPSAVLMQIARECIVELTERDLLPDTVDPRTNHCGRRHGVRDKEPVVVVVVVVGWVSTWPGEKPLAPAARVW
jgi:hypothetical protein